MTDETKTCQLVVRQSPSANPKMDELVFLLQDKHSLDAYTARHRLTGHGKSLFGSGSLEKTGQLAALLRNYDFDCWVIQRTNVLFTPLRLRELEISPDRIELVCREKTILLSRGSSVVAVLADVSGQIEERCVRRHMTQRNYRSAKHMTFIGPDGMVQAVMKGTPVLDLYLLDGTGQPTDAVRIIPGRFDAKGLAERMTMSAMRNMATMVELSREYAGQFVLHADFGLGHLPDCQIKNLDGQLIDDVKILASLTRFGWLMCDLAQDQPEDSPEEIDPTLVAVAVASGQPALAVASGPPALAAAIASGNVEVIPGLKEVAREIKVATQDDALVEEEDDDQWLPLPPERPETKISGRMLLSLLGTFLLSGLFVLLGQGHTPLLHSVVELGVKAGLVPGLISVALCWAGFHFVRLKRKIENTPTSRIRSLAMGLVEVHGRTVRKYALVSPMSQSPCIYYRLRKYKKDNRNQWTLKSDKNSSHVPFLVDDGTGMVTVDPMGSIVRAKTSQTGFPGEMTLAFQGVSADDQDEKWVEDIIYEGSDLYVLGFAQPLRENRKGLRERTAEKLRDLKLDRRALHRYDTDDDGRISEEEWQVARGDAEQDALKAHLAEGSRRKRQEEHAVIARAPQRGIPFVIAEAVSEANLTRNYGLISIPLLAAGVATAGFSLYKLLEFLGV